MFKLIGFVNASWAPLKWVVGFENVGYEWTSNVVYAWLYTFDCGCESLPPSSSSLSLPSSIFKSLSSHKSLYFASRKRILRKIKVNNIKLLNPRTILIYDINSKETIFEKREFFKIQKIKRTEEKKLSTIKETLEKAVVKRISKKGSVGVLFSGGIDSLLIIMILLKLKIPFAAYFAHSKEYGKDKDLVFVKELSKLYKFKLKIACVDKKDVEKEIPKIVKIIDSANPIAVGVGLPIYFASRLARKDGIEILFSGLGADELFAGYFKFRESKNISKDTIDLLHKMYRSDSFKRYTNNKKS